MGIGKKLLSSLVSLSFVITPVLSLNINVAASEVDAVKDKVVVSKFPEVLNAGSTASEEAYWRQFSTDYYYNQLSTNEKKLYDRLDDYAMDLLLGTDSVYDYYSVDTEDLNLSKDASLKVQYIFKLSNPQYFFLESMFSVSVYSSDENSPVGANMYVYNAFSSGSTRASARDYLKSVFEDYLDYLDDYTYPEQKEIVLVGLMCENITYDTSANLNQSVYSAAIGETVCTGYSLLFTALMNACGIECVPVCSDDHAWNFIKIHGYWYYCDVTWADQDEGDWIYFGYYNHEVPSDSVMNTFKSYLPDFYYDMLNSDYNYTSRYVIDNGVYYCIISDTSSTGRLVVPVSGSSSASSISIGGYTYTVVGVPGTGWKKEGSAWRYYDASGYKVKGWYQIDSDWYYFNDSGDMQKGWQSVNDTWYYLGGNGIMRTGWQSVDGDWYYFDDNGAMVKGWERIGGSWYYFGGNGVMRKYWQSVDGSWYYFSSDGAMRTKWLKISNQWYYFGDSGVMRTGWQAVNGKWYYLDSSGAMKTGWTKVDGSWYYFDSEGAMQTGWKYSSGSWYYLDTNGKMVTGTKVINGKEYKFNDEGVCQNP